MERLLIAGTETETGRHLTRHFAEQTEVLGVPLSTGALTAVCSQRRLSQTTPESVRLVLETERISKVVYCGEASRCGWSSPSPQTGPCSDTFQVQAWSEGCWQADVPFVFISSDSQFDAPWVFHAEDSESLAKTPLSASIREQEAIVGERVNSLIVRSHVCGFSPESLLTRCLLQETAPPAGDRLWFATPIYAGRFATLLQALLASRATGIYHLAGGERISRSQLLTQLAERFPTNTNEPRVTSAVAKPESGSPRETSLRCSRVRQVLNAGLPSTRDFLDDIAADLSSGTAHACAELRLTRQTKVA